jgi:hypothetical protein
MPVTSFSGAMLILVPDELHTFSERLHVQWLPWSVQYLWIYLWVSTYLELDLERDLYRFFSSSFSGWFSSEEGLELDSNGFSFGTSLSAYSFHASLWGE